MATPSLQSLERGLAILEALNRIPGMGIDSLAALLKLTRGTTYRLIETLRRDGYVERADGRGKYMVTERVLSLSDGCQAAACLQDQVHTLLIDLSSRFRWPTAIATPHGLDMVLRVTTDHKTPYVKRRYTVGSRRPMLSCSSGRVYLANCDAAHREMMLQLLSADARRRVPDAEDSHEDIPLALRRIRIEGFSANESAEHVTNISVPLFQNDKVAGGLVMRYFTSAMDISTAREKLVPALTHAADQIRSMYY